MGQSLSLFFSRLLGGQTERRLRQQLAREESSKAISKAEMEQRLATALPQRPSGELIWMHIASIDGHRPALELMQILIEDRPDAHPLLTVSPDVEITQADAFDFKAQAICEDFPSITKRFVEHHQPDILLWFGGKFRPNAIAAAHARNITCVAIDTADTELTLANGKTIPGLRKQTLSMFDHVIAIDAQSAKQWKKHGVDGDRVEILGPLSEGSSPLHLDSDQADSFTALLATRPCWFAAALDLEEVPAIITAHQAILRKSHRALLALSMKKQEDCAEARNLVAKSGLQVRWAIDETSLDDTDQVLVVPSSENTLWHRLAPVSFLGSSMSNAGGIDPYSAAAMGSAIVHGAHVSNHITAYNRLSQNGASQLVKNTEELRRAIDMLMSPDKAATLANAAWDISSAGAEATDRANNLAQDFLDLRERIAP